MRTARNTKSLLATAAVALPAVIALAAQASPGQSKVRYNRDVRPILAENCFPCHGPDSASRKADLRLDRPLEATAKRGDHSAIAPGKPDASELIKRVTGVGPQMPPAGHKPLTPKQIATLRQWITEGAEYERHWSYIPPVKPALPGPSTVVFPSSHPQREVYQQLWKSWPRNPIDRFVLAKLQAAGLTPAPEADRRTLARRLSLDLTGLPPEPVEVDAFVKDQAPDYYERFVDKLMSKPQWGEHRGRYWLDYARYADSNGIHFDNYREIYAYRDWVIKAFNRNMPYDQFTVEQLAGDLLPHPTLDQLIATGFNRCNITTNEGGVIPEEYQVFYARDRTETVGWVFLGSTLNCAVCHDHKFDPFSQRDFYSLSAFFNNTTQPVMDGNIQNTPPVIPVPREEDRARFDALQGLIASARKDADGRKAAARPDFDKWLASASASSVPAPPSSGLRFHAALSEGQGKEITAEVDGKPVQLTASAQPGWEAGEVAEKAFQRKMGAKVEVATAGDFEKDQKFTYAAWVKLSRADQGGAVFARMDNEHDYRGWDMWLEGGKVGTHIISKWPENALKVVSREPLSPNKWHHICITYAGGAKPDSVTIYVDGQRRDQDVAMDKLNGSIRTPVALSIGQRHSSEGADGAGIQDVRLYDRALTAEEAATLAGNSRAAYLASRSGAASTAEKEELFGWWLTGADEPYRTLKTKLASLEGEDREIRMRGTQAQIMHEKDSAPSAYVLYRGEYDKRRDPVTATTPASLPAMSAEYPRNRLGLAKWIVSPENPLIGRVTVNRYWQEIFGTGIVRTTADFGITGELPTNQELLDWLAVEFTAGKNEMDRTASSASRHLKLASLSTALPAHNGLSDPYACAWDVKKLIKMIVCSATYRQSGQTTPEKLTKDPNNQFLSRGPRFRMDAEMIRDYALAASGLLARKIGGPSVKPYQPAGVWEAVAMPESNTRNYKQDTGDNLYRRSMYTLWKRAAPPASMDIFNAPSRETCTVRRERTDTPLQALVTLNSEQFVEAARFLAQRALKEGGATADARLQFIAMRLLARPFSAAELAVARKSATDLQAYYAAHADDAKKLITYGDSKPDPTVDAPKLAAWTMLTNQLLNLDEVLCK